MEYTFTKENFEIEVLNSQVPVLVDFWAVWCGPCQMQMPILEQLAEEKGLSAKVGKINVDEQQELALRYGVELIPTLLVFKNGEVSTKFVGLTPLEKLKEAL